MTSPLCQVFILCFVLSFSSTCVNSVILFDYKISIKNKASETNEVHCILRGEDLGVHPFNPNDFYEVDIPIVVKGDNSVFCDVKLIVKQFKHGNFELFNFDRDKDSCDDNNTCHWEVQDGGLCLAVGDKCNLFFYWSN